MELEVKNLRYVYKGKRLLHHVSFTLDSSKIIGITGEHKSLLLEILDLQKRLSGQIYVDHEVVGFHNKSLFQRQIALVPQKNVFFTTTVFEEMKFIMDYYHYEGKDLEKRMVDSLKVVGLSKNILDRKIQTLSSGEKVLFKIACSLIMNPKILLFDEVFEGLDGSSKKALMKLFRKLRDRKDRLIVIASNDVNLLYEFTDQVIVLKNGTVLRNDSSALLFQDLPFLQEYGMDVPNLVQFSTLAKNKGIRLNYHRDILDLIKDVYKHV